MTTKRKPRKSKKSNQQETKEQINCKTETRLGVSNSKIPRDQLGQKKKHQAKNIGNKNNNDNDIVTN